jgi:MarR family 2-MHQ and catechol resistance regulon transcriptional repressor
MAEPTYKSDLSSDEKVLMNVLRVLDASKKSQNKMSDVSRIMLVPSANITGLAKRLVQAGFIIKKPDPKDERVTILEITPKGKRTLRDIEAEKDERLGSMLKNLSKNEKFDLLDKIKRILKNGIDKK